MFRLWQVPDFCIGYVCVFDAADTDEGDQMRQLKDSIRSPEMLLQKTKGPTI